MPIVTPKSDGPGAFEQLYSPAGLAQVLYPDNPFPVLLPTTLAAGATWNSGLIYAEGYRNITVGILMTQAGTLSINLYLDLLGTMPRVVTGSPFTIVANTLLITDIPPAPTQAAPNPYQPPFVTMSLAIANTAVSDATLSKMQLILQAG